jgi:hypothetical protein
VAAEWLAPLLCILEIPVSNPSPVTGYPDWSFRDFSQSLQVSSGIVSYNRPRPLPSTYFPIHQSPFKRRYILSVTGKASLNRLYINKSCPMLLFTSSQLPASMCRMSLCTNVSLLSATVCLIALWFGRTLHAQWRWDTLKLNSRLWMHFSADHYWEKESGFTVCNQAPI